MTNVNRLRRELKLVGFPPADVDDLVAALQLVGREEHIAEMILGWAQATACAYHAAKSAGRRNWSYAVHGPDGPVTAAAGPQSDPGDETPSMFD